MMRDRVFYGCRPKCMLTQPTAHSMLNRDAPGGCKKDSAVFIYPVAICRISLEVKHDLAMVESPVRVWYTAPVEFG